MFTSPLLLATLGLLVGVTVSELAALTLSCWLVLGAGFAGAISGGVNATWPLFTFGAVAFLFPFLTILVTYTVRATAAGGATKELYNRVGVISTLAWAAYPIIWAVSNGGHHANPDEEAVLYSTFDIVTCCVVGFIIQWSPEAIAAAPGFLAEHDEAAAAKTTV